LQTTVRVIDRDGDCEFSAEEIAGSPKQLKRLDADGDGALSASEMYDKRVRTGFGTTGGPGGQRPGRSTGGFDISRFFNFLDRNKDGQLTEAEVKGSRMAQRLADFDKNGDNIISKEEIESASRSQGRPGGGRGMSGGFEGILRELLTWPRDSRRILPGENHKAFNGYTLYCESGIGSDIQVNKGTYLLDNKGNVVHEWKCDRHSPEGASGYLAGNCLLLRQVAPSDWLEMEHYPVGSHGIIELFDWKGNRVWEYKRIARDKYCLHHDCEPMPNGNILVLSYEAVPDEKVIAMGGQRTQSRTGGDVRWFEKILELKPNLKNGTTEVVWQWNSIDHLVQDVDHSKNNYGDVAESVGRFDLNYTNKDRQFHFNSIDYNTKRDQIVISSLTYGEIYIIDHSTTSAEAATSKGGRCGKGGDIIYRWGNPAAYGAGTERDRKLRSQHDARWMDGGVKHSGDLLIHNNMAGRASHPSGRKGPFDLGSGYSSLLEIRLPSRADGSYKKDTGQPYDAEITWSYTAKPSTSWQAPFMGGASRLPNGNTIIVNSFNKRVFEITKDGEVVLNYHVPGPGRIFRVYKFASNYAGLRGRDLSPKHSLGIE